MTSWEGNPQNFCEWEVDQTYFDEVFDFLGPVIEDVLSDDRSGFVVEVGKCLLQPLNILNLLHALQRHRLKVALLLELNYTKNMWSHEM